MNIAWTTATTIFAKATLLFLARPTATAREAVSLATLAVQFAWDVQRLADEATNTLFEELVNNATHCAETAGEAIHRIDQVRATGVTNV